MTTTAPLPSSRPRSPGSHERHRAHMNEIRALRGVPPKDHTYTPTTERSIDLSDTDEAGTTTAEDRLARLEDSLEALGEQVADGTRRMLNAAETMAQKVDEMKRARFTLDETTIQQLGAALRAEFARTSQELLEAHSRAVSDRVGQHLAGDFFQKTREAIAQTVPGDSPLGKIAKVCAIVGGVVVAGMAATYGYAVMNYEPPRTTVEVNGATGEATAGAAGGSAL